MTATHRYVRLAVCAAVLGVLTSAPVSANVRSQALYARGLLPYNTGQWDDAYRWFDQAVQADGTDAVALYYRGLTQARRGATAAAIQDMEQAVRLQPGLPHVSLDLGIAYFDSGQYAQAQSWLERAYQEGSERWTVAFFLGLTAYRMGDDVTAQRYLNEATADPELKAAAEYYLGLSLLRQGQTAAAQVQMSEAARERPQPEVGKLAEQYTARAQGRTVPGAVEAQRKKPWSLFAELDFQHDSNVNIGPSDNTLKVPTNKGDGAAALAAGGNYTLLDSTFGSVWAHYDFYQSIHFRLTEFDLQGHRLQLNFVSKPGRFTYGATGTYDVYFLNYQTFYQEGLFTPWVTFAEGEPAATQLYYTLRGRDFFREPYDPGRDATNNAVGLRQYLELGRPEYLLGFGYQFDAEDTTSSGPMGRDFQYDGNQLDIGASGVFGSRAHVDIGYLFRLEDYQFPNSHAPGAVQLPNGTIEASRRHDHEHELVLALAYDLTANLAATADFIYVNNGSNIPEFEYDREIASLGVRLSY